MLLFVVFVLCCYAIWRCFTMIRHLYLVSVDVMFSYVVLCFDMSCCHVSCCVVLCCVILCCVVPFSRHVHSNSDFFYIN